LRIAEKTHKQTGAGRSNHQFGARQLQEAEQVGLLPEVVQRIEFEPRQSKFQIWLRPRASGLVAGFLMKREQ
jgi:hypothetical protein